MHSIGQPVYTRVKCIPEQSVYLREMQSNVRKTRELKDSSDMPRRGTMEEKS